MAIKNQKREDANICTNCSNWIDSIKEKLEIDSEVLKDLEKPERVLTFKIPLQMDDSSVKQFNGYRVQYNTALGPAKGGVRFHQEVDLDEVKTLSFLMSLKTSLVNLPLGGGKGGIEINPDELSENEIEKLTRSFVRQLYDFIGPEKDIPAPDINTNSKIMDYFVDEYSKIIGNYTPQIVTGKSIENGGSLGREKATSLGGAFVLDEIIGQENINRSDLSVVIQGYGNVGKNIAEILNDWNYKIIAVSNASGGFYKKDGINLENIEKGSDKISNSELLELETDILIPAAISDQITKDNADNIKAKYILEMANAPITQEADLILNNKEKVIIPDILANSGGVIVSYYEWLQNKNKESWPEEEVNNKLKDQIINALKHVQEEKEQYPHLTTREASYNLAIKRIIEAEKSRNWIK